ncbi:MAG: hypothetical protein MK132_22420 [Lentisphaerales bacterium]|nr:hypothetical protein [Lentisphaerales bacterium]
MLTKFEGPSEEQIKSTLSDIKEELKEDFKKKRKEILKPLIEAAETLKAEATKNAKNAQTLSAANIPNLQKVSDDFIDALNKLNLKAVKSTQVGVIKDVKIHAAESLTVKAEDEFPDLNIATLKKEADQKYTYYKVGDNVKLRYAPTPNRVLTASGPIRSMDTQRVKIGFSTISINDIVDRIERLAMSKTETLKQRATFVEEKVLERKVKRQQYYNDNIQSEVDKLVTANEAKGYVLNLGTWKPHVEVVSQEIQVKVASLKKTVLEDFEKVSLDYSRKSESLSQAKKDFTADFLDLRGEIEKELTSDSLIAITEAKQAAFELSEAKQEQILKDQIAAKEKEKAEKQARILKEKAEAAAAIKAKRDAINNQSEIAEESDSSTLIIALAIAAICLLGFVSFNKKVHDKILGNKKQSMADIVIQNAIDAHQSMPKPESQQIPVGPKGNMAPQLITRPPIDRTKVDVDISVETTDAEKNKLAGRKKIALNLKGSTTSLDKDLLAPSTPPIGGLTPPGGGMTPPKVSTPPEESADKSNLILNPNLQADGQKLQLKK